MTEAVRRVLVTGANGFIGKNVVVRLAEMPDFVVSTFCRGDAVDTLPALVAKADAVLHLAGENRPPDESAFAEVNTGLTEALCDAIRREYAVTGRRVALVLASSTQAETANAYGRSKLGAERAVQALTEATGNPTTVFRLPGVFGKWCKPHYNSVVATFCHQIARGLPVRISDPAARLRLVYVDDVVSALIAALTHSAADAEHGVVQPEFSISLGELAAQIQAFSACRDAGLHTERVGVGLVRALYATYVSYLPTEQFAYEVLQYADARGVFVEMLKTPDCGQFSYFTAHPGITRGGHYHHTKTEKFLVMKGRALFRFRHLLTNERYELHTSGDQPQVVDTIPGWTHDITNVGEDELVVMLWANEIFDRQNPDTISSPI